ncbi:MFS transporter [Agromyces sp. SYSU T0242]|uniref:MFS transporter n=1 Tax=Agromyces litoreus TaxID=3158561 RepID=UPI003390FD0F
MTAPERRLSRSDVARYAIGSIGTGGFATLPGLVLVFYLTDTLGVSALLAAIVVAAAKVWDVLIDPWIGERSDRALARTGTRRTWMRIGALALPVTFAITFAVPIGIGPVAAGAWVMVAFLATATAFSLFQVPYIALPAELTDDYDGRTRLLTWRVVLLTAAILAFGAGGPLLRGVGGTDEALGYLVMAVVAGVVIAAGMLVATIVAPTGRAVPAASPRGRLAGYTEGIAALRRSRPFRLLLAAFLLQGLATGAMLAGANFVAVRVLHSEDALTLLFLALIGPALVCAPIWGRLARRIGKEASFAFASVVFAVATASLAGMLWAPGAWVYLPVGIAGAAYAGMQSLPMAMLPDVIAHDARSHGPGRAGSFGGIWTAGETTGMALGATLFAVVLAMTGYVESVGATEVTQPAAAIAGIIVSFSLLPSAIAFASLVPILRYPLRRVDLDAGAVEDDARAVDEPVR